MYVISKVEKLQFQIEKLEFYFYRDLNPTRFFFVCMYLETKLYMTLYSIFIWVGSALVNVVMTLLVATPLQVSCIKGPPVLMTRSNWSFDEALVKVVGGGKSSMSRTWSAPKLNQLSWVYLGERQDTSQPQLKTKPISDKNT